MKAPSVAPGQEALFDLPQQAAPSPLATEGLAPLPSGIGYDDIDDRADRRAEVLAETMGWSPESARSAAGVTVNEPGVTERYLPLQGPAHRARAEQVRQHLASLGVPPTNPDRRGRRW